MYKDDQKVEKSEFDSKGDNEKFFSSIYFYDNTCRYVLLQKHLLKTLQLHLISKKKLLEAI